MGAFFDEISFAVILCESKMPAKILLKHDIKGSCIFVFLGLRFLTIEQSNDSLKQQPGQLFVLIYINRISWIFFHWTWKLSYEVANSINLQYFDKFWTKKIINYKNHRVISNQNSVYLFLSIFLLRVAKDRLLLTKMVCSGVK